MGSGKFSSVWALGLATVMAVLVPGCADGSAQLALPRTSVSPEGAAIAQIQGMGHVSPLVGQRVSEVVGVVTAVSRRDPRHGFWMESADPDGDPRTSEGLFVVLGEEVAAPSIGTTVEVSGVVAEAFVFEDELTVTALVDASVLRRGVEQVLADPQRLGRGGRAIPNREFGSPDGANEPELEALDFFESLEGMRVSISDPWVTGATRSFGEIVVLVDGGAGVEARSARGGAVVSGARFTSTGVDDFNPERIAIDPRRGGFDAPRVNVGDSFAGVVSGVIDYSFSNYKLVPVHSLPQVVKSSLRRDSSRLRGSADVLSIASYNILNLGGDDSQSTFDRIAKTIVGDLGSPAILALQEVQDDDGPVDRGTVSADLTLDKLQRSIVTAGGPRYDGYQISPVDKADGGQPGGNIRVAFLADPTRVTVRVRGRGTATLDTEVAAGPQLTLSPGRIGSLEKAFENSRKPLVLEVEFGGRPLFLINNHWVSKIGDDRLYGRHQPAAQGTEPKRTDGARIVADFVATLFAADPDALVVVLGDLNEHEFREPVGILTAIGLVNLIDRVEIGDRYSYVFEGNAQVLDNVLVSPALAGSHPEIDIVHVNADFPDESQASDHDPVLVLLPLARP